MKILVIDDEANARMLLSDIFEDLGWEMEEAEDCLEGLDKIKSLGPFDLVLVDWKTPRMTGLDFTKNVRSNPDFQSIPLIMVTGLNDMESVADALEVGINEYLMKPFTPEMIFSKLRLVGLEVPGDDGNAML